jgi:uncharacterized repeat protein (TIGR01451 family)
MAESPRPSRQDLVVPPRGSNFPLVLGSLVCAGAGFGLVWSLGIGRTGGIVTLPFAAHATFPDGSVPVAPVDGPDSDAVADGGLAPRTFADDSAPGVPARFPVVDAADVAPADRRGWSPPVPAAAAPAADPRYPARPATLEVPDDARPLDAAGLTPDGAAAPARFAPAPAAAAVRPMSFQPTVPERSARYAPPSLPDEGVIPAGGETEADPAEVAVPPEAAAIPQAAPTGSRFAAAAADAPPSADAAETATAVPEADAGGGAIAADTTVPQPAPAEEAPAVPQADEDASPRKVASAADPAFTGAPPVPTNTPAAAPAGPIETPVAEPAAAAAPPPAPFASPFTPPRALPGSSEQPASSAPVSAAAPLAAPPVSSASTAAPAAPPSPFAAAPPMGPPPAPRSEGFRGGDMPPPAAAALAGGTGQGRPGPAQLEGAQTPQLVVEKRGPREIQVGKAVRYEIIVRNVGKATAQDVTLRDAVPFGTTLVATTPPATPAAGPAELVWPLGTLPPGGETKVAMEVMPQIEGDIGSVASVSFRAEASLRSRATKPDLRLELSQTRPVRIGGDVPLSLKLSNPGTGVATGVVLEGILPDGVSHRAGRDLEFDVGQLRPGESRSIDIVLGTTGPGVHQARFTARADGRIEVEQAARIEITAPTLELQAEMPSRRYLQRPATCVLSMINAGTASARSVELAAQLPPGLKFVRANHAGWYDERTHRVLWSLEELPPGEAGTVEVVLMPVDLGPQKIVAAARSSDGPSHQTSHTVEVEGLAALFFEVTDSEDPIEVGGVTEYIVRIRNQGTKAAGGVRVTASMLGDLEPLDAKGPSAHRIENLSFVFEPLARLSPAEEAVYRLRARGRRAGDQRVQVQVVSDDNPAPTTKEEVTRVYADR